MVGVFPVGQATSVASNVQAVVKTAATLLAVANFASILPTVEFENYDQGQDAQAFL
jgi:hypothetical protein